eukprot:9392590-Pyramimonas_sp.AAC.1
MPGPDGIVYSCWKSPLPNAILYDLYCHLFDNRASDMPQSMREMLLVFLAKGENPTDLMPVPLVLLTPAVLLLWPILTVR